MKITHRYEVKEDENIDPKTILHLLLKNRNVKNIKEFLDPPSPLSMKIEDFGFKTEIKKTLKILEEIKKNNQSIVVYTDYDADGITGGAILWETLHLLGFNVMPYVPHRKLEGYGFSIKGIDNVKKKYDPALIISVDHGITAKEKVSYAKSIGIPIIITDHHLKPDMLPTDAEALFHIPALSGSGVSYFFSKMVFDHFKLQTSNTGLLTSHFSTDYLALASIGTVADLVPLIGPSRSIVKHGLEAFPQVKRVGLKEILKDAGIEGRRVTPYEIGFMIAPRINAVGRLEHAIDALRLLCTRDPKKAHALAANIGEKNRERQDMVTIAVEEAKQIVDHSKLVNLLTDKLIILISDTWHEGIIGLIASKVAESYFRPTIVMTQSDGFLKGSARSVPSFHITDFLRSLKKYLIDVGGHKGAAGFTIEKKKLNTFIKKARQEAKKLISERDLERKMEIDMKIPLSKIHLAWVKELEKLQPFGMGNPQPTFYSKGTIAGAKIFGKKDEHLKLYIKKQNTFPLEFVSFYAADRFTSLSKNQEVSFAFTLEINRWNREEKITGKMIHFSTA